MPARLHKIVPGSIGSSPCEIKLNQILIDLEDPWVTQKVMSRHNQIREGLAKLEPLKDRGFFLSMARIYYEDQLRKFKNIRPRIPEVVYTHALCCYHALYRRAIK